jgi:1,5-anhydro-D-fructose reductase (1,5-anhydro-D-mannitol-forming)
VTDPGGVRWALVGTNGYARRTCAPAFAEVSRARLVGVASADKSRARAFADELGVSIAAASLAELCAREEVDAVWIASPSYLHYDHGAVALAAGKHVLLEKPLALSSQEAWKLVSLAAEQGVTLATGYQARYVPAHIRMKELLEDGAIGIPVLARTLYGMHRPGPPRTWRQHRETARWGTLADIGTHHLDLLRMLLGEVAAATGYTAHRTARETEDTATAVLRFTSGVIGSLTATSVTANPSTVVEVHGTEGAIVATGTSPDGQGKATLLRPGTSPRDITGPTPLSAVAQLETVTGVIAGDPEAYATGADGARNVEILEQITS